MTVVVYVLLSLLLIVLGFSVYALFALFFPKTWDHEHEFDFLYDNYGFDLKKFRASVKLEPFWVVSDHGYSIYGEYAKNDRPNRNNLVVVFSHGRTGNLHTMSSYADIYWKLGCSLVFYDHRRHGNTKRNISCSLGLFESDDLVSVCKSARNFFPPDSTWGIQGESMGSVSAILALGRLPFIRFCCADSCYDSAEGLYRSVLKLRVHMPWVPFGPVTKLLSKVFLGIDFDKISPLEAIGNVEIPVLFGHGQKDTIAPVEMAHRLTEAKKKGFVRLYIFEDAIHAKAILMHPDIYMDVIRDFLRDSGLAEVSL